MQQITRQILQAILGNGYELQIDRHRQDGGTGISLHNPLHREEAFYFFTDTTESQVLETMAWQYCSATQLNHLFPDRSNGRASMRSITRELQFATAGD